MEGHAMRGCAADKLCFEVRCQNAVGATYDAPINATSESQACSKVVRWLNLEYPTGGNWLAISVLPWMRYNCERTPIST